MPTTSLDDLSFKEDENKITPQEEPSGSEELALNNFWEQGDVSGEVTSRDRQWPKLQVGQKSGDIGEQFGLGSVTLNKEFVILPGVPQSQKEGPALNGVIVLKIHKLYQEKREFNPSAITKPRIFQTSKEAHEAGFTTEWGSGERQALPFAVMLLMLPPPETMAPEFKESLFPYEFNGQRFLAAGYWAGGTAYASMAKPVFTQMETPKSRAHGELALRAPGWSLSVERKSSVKGSYYTPKLILYRYNSPELMQFTKSLVR